MNGNLLSTSTNLRCFSRRYTLIHVVQLAQLVLALGAGALLCSGVANAGLYKWTDEKGRVHYSDSIPPEALKQSSTQLNSSGRVTARRDAALTPEQIAAREKAAEAVEAEKKRFDLQKRFDASLIATYVREKDFDNAIDRGATPIEQLKLGLKDRLKGLDERQAQVDAELEFYKSGSKKKLGKDGKPAKVIDVPPQLMADTARINKERDQINVTLKRAEVDAATIRNRIATDKARWLQLKAGAAPGSVPSSAEIATKTATAAGPISAVPAIAPAPAPAPAIAPTPAPPPASPTKK